MSDQTLYSERSYQVQHPGNHNVASLNFHNRLEQSAASRPFVHFLDEHYVFRYDGDLSKHHRWTADDVGRQFLLAEQPDDLPMGLIALCKAVHIEKSTWSRSRSPTRNSSFGPRRANRSPALTSKQIPSTALSLTEDARFCPTIPTKLAR